jgi:hypothetical protein
VLVVTRNKSFNNQHLLNSATKSKFWINNLLLSHTVYCHLGTYGLLCLLLFSRLTQIAIYEQWEEARGDE